MVQEDEAPLDDRDLLGVLRLARHLAQRPAARRTRPVAFGELVHDVDGRQRGLRRRAVARRAAGRAARPAGVRGALWTGAERDIAVREDFLEGFDLALGGAGPVAAKLAQLARRQ
jgi:hypothetical protein